MLCAELISLVILAIQVERVYIGEEVSYTFVADVLRVGVEQWNHCVREVVQRLESPEVMLQLLDQTCLGKGEMALEQSTDRIRALLEEHLKEISVKDKEGNWMIPNSIGKLLSLLFLC